MSIVIEKILSDDIAFSLDDYVTDRVLFNYIEGARQYETSQFFSDHKHVIICRKENKDNVWIWTDSEIKDDKEAMISIANVVKDFATPNLQFFTKPEIAQTFSDMYALLSCDLNYQVKSEYSLGAYKFTSKKLPQTDEVSVLKYNKKFSDELYDFYMSLKDEFHWGDEKVKKMCDKYATLNTYLLLKNGDVKSVCVISDDDGDYSSIRSVATKTDERNKGYATILTNIASHNCEKGGSEKLMLYANNANLSAVSTFKKAGYELVGNIHLIKS